MSETMFYLTIALYCLQVMTASCQTSVRTCDRTQTESAGASGSIEFRGNCRLTLRSVQGKINIGGVSKQVPCNGKPQIFINSEYYCADNSVAGVIIEVGDSSELTLNAPEQVPYPIHYYHGECFSYQSCDSNLMFGRLKLMLVHVP